MSESAKEKSYRFALRIVKMCGYLRSTHKEFIISKQLLRSGTSIGANLSEAVYAQSKADFISKNSIALKEAAETRYWLTLLFDSEYLTEKQYISVLNDVEEIIKMLTSIVNTSKNNS
jgi:four helix bundle protein